MACCSHGDAWGAASACEVCCGQSASPAEKSNSAMDQSKLPHFRVNKRQVSKNSLTWSRVMSCKLVDLTKLGEQSSIDQHGVFWASFFCLTVLVVPAMICEQYPNSRV